MFKEGQILNINGEKGIICFVTEFNNSVYINVSFGEEQFNFRVYRVEIEGSEAVFFEEKNNDILQELYAIFVSNSIFGEIA